MNKGDTYCRWIKLQLLNEFESLDWKLASSIDWGIFDKLFPSIVTQY